MIRPEECPKCSSKELCESCYSTHPFRMTFCKCGWDNLSEIVHESGKQVLDALLAARERGVLLHGFSLEEMEEGIRNLQDPKREASFIASVRGN